MGSEMIVFGGRIDAGFCDDLLSYEIEAKKWTEVKSKGEIPKPRSGHSSVVYGNTMIVFGGYGSDFKNKNDLFFYDIPSKTWKKIKSLLAIPSPRSYHRSVCIQGTMFVYGGKSEDDETGDIFALDLKNKTWTIVGRAPSNLFGHSIALTPDNSTIVFGGKQKIQFQEKSTNGMIEIFLDTIKRRLSLYSIKSYAGEGESSIFETIEVIVKEKKYSEKRKALILTLLEDEFIDTCEEWRRMNETQKSKFPIGFQLAMDEKIR
jgi:N-acetylneuraminic acid mutarotase